jgi:transposase
VGEDNAVRVIDGYVNVLDLGLLGFTKTNLDPRATGRPSYSPESLLKLYIYGYYAKIRSSRKLMVACTNDMSAMWLMCRLEPDFRTIADFRKENAEALKKVFKMFVRLCIDMGLYSTAVGVQDGSKFRADNSKGNNVTVPKLEKKIEIAEEKIEKYMNELDNSDDEEETQKYTKEEIEDKLTYLRENIDRYEKTIEEMKESGES